ncbi:hypothetical protein GPECTOR_24g187 [Gonium pectorale]|uniref:Uncharacterized protein n=1 Tax=Gonium pectorale TaxID=33097 RepID=A0A150GGD9_GONPE|nr:hypothetical protein GPECTOR_24g187 [Gonium pectorale]|eukprot:KXZ48898.1 hypothetical protein GPECTOR_24g187 [Gonium pectorale]
MRLRDLAILEMLIGCDAEVFNDHQGCTCMSYAVMTDDAELVQLMLDAGADPWVDERRGGRTVLHETARNGHIEALRLLVRKAKQSDLDVADKNGDTPLMHAAYQGNVEAARILLDAGANSSRAALVKTLYSGSADMVKMLLDGAKLKPGGTDGMTALMMAAKGGHVEVVKDLLDAGADLYARDRNGMGALMMAAKGGHVEVVKVLLAAARADVNAADMNGMTALMMAAKGGHVEVVKVLLAARADVNAADMDGTTALTMAAKGGHVEVVKVLLAAAGANVNAADMNGTTALTMAAKGGHVEVVKVLLAAARADVNAADMDSKTPLMHAAQADCVEVVKELLEAGADARAADRRGRTAYDLTGSEEVKKLLLQDAGGGSGDVQASYDLEGQIASRSLPQRAADAVRKLSIAGRDASHRLLRHYRGGLRKMARKAQKKDTHGKQGSQ